MPPGLVGGRAGAAFGLIEGELPRKGPDSGCPDAWRMRL